MPRFLLISISLSLFGLSACEQRPSLSPTDPFEGYAWVDLSHSYDAETIFWPTGKPFEHIQTAWGETEGGYFYSSFDFFVSEHAGTHLDSPIHFSAGKQTVDQLAISRLAGPAVVIDVTSAVATDPDYLVSVDDIESAGEFPDGAIVLVRTDWSSRWPDTKAYLGDDRPGRTDDLHFAGIAPEAARLLAERGVTAVGIDTASIDHGPSTDFQTHQILAELEIVGLENLTNLAALPERGAYVIALPMKIGGGSGAPCRVVALVPRAGA